MTFANLLILHISDIDIYKENTLRMTYNNSNDMEVRHTRFQRSSIAAAVETNNMIMFNGHIYFQVSVYLITLLYSRVTWMDV